MRRLLVVLLIAASFSCGKNPAQPAANLILVTGVDMSLGYQEIDLSRNGSPLDGAQVQVNGTTIPAAGVVAGRYFGAVPELLAPGAPVTLEVRVGGDLVTGKTTVPAEPVLVAPVSGAGVHLGTPLAFSWTAPSNPDEFLLWIFYRGGDARLAVSGSARNGSVATTAIPTTATDLEAVLFAYGNGVFTGPADPASKMHLRQEATHAPLVIVF